MGMALNKVITCAKEGNNVYNVAKKKEATESVIIFRYLPDGKGKVALGMIYDDQIAEKYDALNNAYFEADNSTREGRAKSRKW